MNDEERLPRLQAGDVRHGFRLVRFDDFAEGDNTVFEVWECVGSAGLALVPFDPDDPEDSDSDQIQSRRPRRSGPRDGGGGRGYGPAEIVRDAGRVLFPAFRRD